MEKIVKSGERILAALRALVGLLVILFFGYMFTVVMLQVIGRYVLNFSIGWAAETATFAQIWIIFLAAGLAMRDRMHVGIDMIFEKLPLLLQKIVSIAILAVGILFLAVTIWGSSRLITIGLSQTSPVLQLPMWLPYLSIPVGLGYFGLEFIIVFLRKAIFPAEGYTADERS